MGTIPPSVSPGALCPHSAMVRLIADRMVVAQIVVESAHANRYVARQSAIDGSGRAVEHTSVGRRRWRILLPGAPGERWCSLRTWSSSVLPRIWSWEPQLYRRIRTENGGAVKVYGATHCLSSVPRGQRKSPV